MRLALALLFVLACGAPAAADETAQQSKDVQTSQTIYDNLDSQHLIDHHSPYDRILQSVGARISKAAQPHWFTEKFVVVKSSELNAYATPGGTVFVNEGLLSNLDDVDELANVLGHETAHLALGHLDTLQTTSQRKDIAYSVGHFLAGQSGSQSAQQAYSAGTTLGNYGFLNFTRQQEYAADQLGVTLAARAGFNPWGSVWFFKELERTVGDAGYEQYVEQHPSTKDRISQIETFINGNPQQFGRWTNAQPSAAGLPRTP
jgi:beta-barrel assembly-enhancing protease